MADQLTTLKTLLTDNWNSSNTDSLTPTINIITDVKQINAVDGDHILLYEVNEEIKPFGLGANAWHNDNIASIDIRTTYQAAEIPNIRPHLIKIKDEVERILKANVRDPDSNFNLLLPLRRKDLSDKSIGLGRMIIDVNLNHWGS